MGCPRMLGGMSNRGVCGSDGVTYMNECELKRANCERSPSDEEISLVYNDNCESECALNPMGINMQCGTNGLTYWNMCALKEFNYLNRATDPYAESISVAYPGPCSVTNVQMLNDFPTENTCKYLLSKSLNSSLNLKVNSHVTEWNILTDILSPNLVRRKPIVAFLGRKAPLVP